MKVLGSPMVDPNSERDFFRPIDIPRLSWLQIPWFLGQVLIDFTVLGMRFGMQNRSEIKFGEN